MSIRQLVVKSRFLLVGCFLLFKLVRQRDTFAARYFSGSKDVLEGGGNE